ncbi:glutathione S-transferase N-terminal domain-containing protein [candidate division KSB1 bacterium]
MEQKPQPKIKLYQFEHCPYCEKVRQKLKEKGLEWETVEVNRANKPDIVLNTGGTVPVVDIDGKIISDSAIIIRYLDENF